MTGFRFAVSLLVGAASAMACSSNKDAPVRSPSQDYPAPPTTTADGDVVGADRTDPGDKLEQGARLGQPTTLAPGWKATDKGLTYDPKERTGGAVDRKTVNEPPPTQRATSH